MQRTLRRFISAVSFLALSSLATPGLYAGASIATHYFVFVDCSSSITQAQRTNWNTVADDFVAQLNAGDAVTVFPIHANTFGASAILNVNSKEIPRDLGLDELSRRRKSYSQLRVRVRDTLHAVLAKPEPTPETDIFGALDRITAADSSRKVAVVIFSDMVQSTRRELDMERVSLTEENIGPLIQEAGRTHRWQPGTLTGVVVKVIVPGLSGATPQRDNRLLRAFWETLFRSLGGRLDHWDTDF